MPEYPHQRLIEIAVCYMVENGPCQLLGATVKWSDEGYPSLHAITQPGGKPCSQIDLNKLYITPGIVKELQLGLVKLALANKTGRDQSLFPLAVTPHLLLEVVRFNDGYLKEENRFLGVVTRLLLARAFSVNGRQN